ncbi:phage tail tube protein, partial [Herbiconiux daphne]
TGFYDGDGTPETTVMSVSAGYSFEGFFDPTDDAQALVAGKKYKIGTGRKVWHMVVSSDATTMWTGRATITDIVAGAGDATEYEEFSCTIRFDRLPTEAKASGVGVPPHIGGQTPVQSIAITINAGQVGDTLDLAGTATITPSNADLSGAQWISLDTTIATVDQRGQAKLIKAGTVEIVVIKNGVIGKADITVTTP